MDDLAMVAAALGDPLRVRILDLLAAGRCDPCCSPANPEKPAAVCACDLAAGLGGLAASKLAYHLGLLRAAGLVREQRRGKWVYYSVACEALTELARVIAHRWSKGGNACRVDARCLPAPAPRSAAGGQRSRRRPV